MTGEKLTYLIETPDTSKAPWGLGCSLCRAAGFKNQYAFCRAKGRLCNILRHGNVLPDQVAGTMPLTSDHSKALDLWKAKVQKQLSVQKTSDTEESGDKKKEAPPTAISYSHVLFNRTLVETGGSFRDFKKWAETARLSGAALPPGADDRRISAQITHCMAEEERLVTSKLLQAASAAALKQDGRGQHVMNTHQIILQRQSVLQQRRRLPATVRQLLILHMHRRWSGIISRTMPTMQCKLASSFRRSLGSCTLWHRGPCILQHWS